MGRTLLSAAFDFDSSLQSLQKHRDLPDNNSKSESKAADRSVRPTQSVRYSDGHFGHLYFVSSAKYHDGGPLCRGLTV